MRKTYWLQWKDSDMLYISFDVEGNKVHVKGPIGMITYIDEIMPIQQARKYWEKKVKKEGWHRIPIEKAPNKHYHDAITYGR